MGLDVMLIIVLGFIETILDYIIFKAIGFQILSFIFSFISGFLIPGMRMLWITYSSMGRFEKINALTSLLASYLMNLPEYLLAYIGSIFASSIIYIATGERFESY